MTLPETFANELGSAFIHIWHYMMEFLSVAWMVFEERLLCSRRRGWLLSLKRKGSQMTPEISGKKQAHKHKLFCPVGLGTTPGLSRGFHRVCPWDKPGLSLGQSQGRRAAQKVYVKKVYVPCSLAKIIERAEVVAYMIYLEGPEYSEYVMHIFYPKYSSPPNMGIC